MKIKIYLYKIIIVCLSGFTLNAHADQLVTSNMPIVFPLLSPRMSSSFGPRIHPIKKVSRHHAGVDLAAPEKSHVRAIMAGRVIYAGTLGGYGKIVSILHGEDKVSLYGHLSEVSVETGELVSAGGIIGRVGSTGAATGPHLHFEWREQGKPINPLKKFPALSEKPLG